LRERPFVDGNKAPERSFLPPLKKSGGRIKEKKGKLPPNGRGDWEENGRGKGKIAEN
jgi:hypothetical protein